MAALASQLKYHFHCLVKIPSETAVTTKWLTFVKSGIKLKVTLKWFHWDFFSKIKSLNFQNGKNLEEENIWRTAVLSL